MKEGSPQPNQRLEQIIKALGGLENISDCTACATRLRVTFKDPQLINKEELQQTGSLGIIVKDRGIQVIYGGEAAIIADQINEKMQIKAA